MKIIGHRGARGLAPENTMASLKKALEHHVDEIEFDVRVTKDNIPVLLHDEEASDAAGNKLHVRESTYDELKQHKPDLATLAEVIEAFGGTVPLLIEVKPLEATKPVSKVIKQSLEKGFKPSDFLLGSFSQKTLRELHRELPEIEKVVIERWSGVKARFRCWQVGTKRVSMKYLWLWGGFLAGFQRAGYQLSPYTMNDPVKVQKWEKHLYGVITDYPDRFEK